MALGAIRCSTGNNALDRVTTSAQIASMTTHHGGDDRPALHPPDHRCEHQLTYLLQPPVPSRNPTLLHCTVRSPFLTKNAQDVKLKTYQQECVCLEQCSARLLMDVGRRMEGKWDDAPLSLLDNIREFEAFGWRAHSHVSLFWGDDGGYPSTLLRVTYS